ncbi:MAG: bifunctional (p)ppGpp synthetase/guanosine-3',5'-bis(diphosphate) 3'-pyrophosphohydrolase [Xanthomonadales bacterium]|nr:bifunctional (p)ppGpp synthetase/guanosine-3',5'-bis(diphosphate) 3'-pyrophosphohydrolase [Gammaproteobacteria bacterium]MBT8073870.1 bifunctional (p)ppGpp synthetase/guanosine-3',5'-bis(diphosphate) 3'-pyrophosphohydrolase [Gammaproteobacteria bacterium]NNK04717.1 bifunctional (p)ppGpp synthetase/guanosine-3',5'-bis(diphosphate) 3'-pyrophosphohydrolase [Xanthomonadales bacterium]
MKGSLDENVAIWLQAYRDSVGSPADECLQLYQDLRQGELGEGDNPTWLRELLEVMSDLSPDPHTVSCAMLFVASECDAELGSILAKASPEVSEQLEQLLYLIELETEHLPASTGHSAEGLRRMLLALVNDVRVVLIALAWQLVKLRRARGGHEDAVSLAEEVMLIHAPLANRLGVWQLKWELEDLAFRYSQPEEYRRTAQLVDERRSDRERFILKFIEELETAIRKAGIKGEVKGRPKHIYSIWKKMQRKGLDFEELFDVRAVRMLVEDIPACYSVLGLVHSMWQPIPGEFDDYITMPKGNNYQSLHTAVIGPEGKAVEVQIRTYDMNEHAELGVASHWRYKEGGPNDPAFDNKIAVMRQLLESGEDRLDDESLLESFKTVASEDRVYVLTPGGKVLDLALGSTVLDFAYQVHTEVGHRCQGAKVNGRIVPLTQQLQTGNRVEILTGKHAKPSRDWLNPRLGFIRGARARAKVRQWFRRESHEENLNQGKEMVEADLKRLGLVAADLESVPERFNFNSVDDLYAAVGNGDLTVSQVVHAVERFKVKEVELTAEDLVTRTPKRRRSQEAKEGDDVTIEGVGNLMTSMARCCQPVPGDSICGYITRGRGVTIHRDDCPNALRWVREDNPRLIQVRWRRQADSGYRVNLVIGAYNRRELIKDISTMMATSDVSVTDINSHLDEQTEEVSIRMQVTVKDYQQLSDLLSRLNTIPNVFEARRLAESN